jgi:hypothetical protein
VVFGRGYAGEPDTPFQQLRQDKAIAEGGTLLLQLPNMVGVHYNAHVALALGWW